MWLTLEFSRVDVLLCFQNWLQQHTQMFTLHSRIHYCLKLWVLFHPPLPGFALGVHTQKKVRTRSVLKKPSTPEQPNEYDWKSTMLLVHGVQWVAPYQPLPSLTNHSVAMLLAVECAIMLRFCSEYQSVELCTSPESFPLQERAVSLSTVWLS